MSDDALDALTVLVVDDEKEVADAYALRLRGFCNVETAYGGADALSVIEDTTVDIVLLDRHMPGLSGDDVLLELNDREFRGRVIMVTAVDPDFDVLDMPFDAYLCKPVDRETLHTVIEQHRTVLAYELLGEYFSAASKQAVVEDATTATERADHEGYAHIAERTANLEQRVRRLLPEEDVLDVFD
jgi:DNA-binding response OmpR family regulator